MELFSLKKEAISRLEKTEVFTKKELYLDILHYLVKAEQEGTSVKSSTIANDLLGIEDGRNGGNQDAVIRTKIQGIRKELKLFYLTEGKTEKYRLTLPKGSYKLELQNVETSKEANYIEPNAQATTAKAGVKRKIWLYSLSMAVCLLLLINTYLLFFDTPAQGNTFQSSVVTLLLGEKKPLTIVVGERGFYLEYDKDIMRYRYVFDFDTDLPHVSEKLASLIQAHPEKQIVHNSFAHVDTENMMLAAELHKEQALMQSKSIIVKSRNLEKIEQNTVFVSKTISGDMYNLSSYFLNSRFKFSAPQSRGSLKYFMKKDSTILDLDPKYEEYKNKEFITSYYIIKKAITPNNHKILFLLPTDDGTRNYFMDRLYEPTFQSELQDSFGGNVPEEFELLLEVKGSQYAGISHKIIYNSFTDK